MNLSDLPEETKKKIEQINKIILESLNKVFSQPSIISLFKGILPNSSDKEVKFHYSVIAHLVPKEFKAPDYTVDLRYDNKEFPSKDSLKSWLNDLTPKDFLK